MLTLFDRSRQHSRRDFLSIGGLALGGLSLPQLLADKARASTDGRPVRDKSVIFLFMHGGPSQIETWDPKMEAPVEIRSATGEVGTAIPGVTFGGTMQRLGPLADKLSVVRSFTTGDSRHDIKPIVSTASASSNLGSIYSRVAGTNHPISGIPLNAALFPRAIDPSLRPVTGNFGKFNSTGLLGSAYAPFVPGAGGELQDAMKLRMPRGRVDDRRNLLASLDGIRRQADASGLLEGMDRFQEQAFDTILGGVADAFDLSKEDPKTIARYDTEPLVRPENISRKWNNHTNYVENAKTLGKLLLLARRLCERGCGFVTVTTSFVWDMHADNNNAGVEEGMQYMGLPFDHAVSAFIEDCQARGLGDDILLVCCGEMGRTPKISNKGGRNHWGALAPLMLSGGGLQMGQVIGQSTRDAGQPQSEPMTNQHLISTIMHNLLDVGRLRITPGIPADVARTITAGEPIPGLL